MKRFLSWFLAVYVIVLTLAPCVDEEVTCREVQQIHATSPSEAQGGNQDTCSPFCTCSCCNISMEVAAPFVFHMIAPAPGELTHFFAPRTESFFTPSIWEPPKA
jgi:hypothetical protein